MTEVIPLNIGEALQDNVPAYADVFGCGLSSGSEDDAAVAEAIFGDSSEDEGYKQSDDDTPRALGAPEARRDVVNNMNSNFAPCDHVSGKSGEAQPDVNDAVVGDAVPSGSTPDACHAPGTVVRVKQSIAQNDAGEEVSFIASVSVR